MAPRRKLWTDWQRGLAVLLMIEVHAVDAWLAPAPAPGALHAALTMLGGFAAPSFLFLAGLSQILGDAKLARRGASAAERRATALWRAGWLLGVAYAFRLLEYVLGGMWRVSGGWRDILRVDVLNVMAVALALAVPLAVGVSRRLHVALAAGAAVAFALATPLVAAWEHPPSRLLDYVYASLPRANFSLFNWAAFVFAGSAAGRLVAERDRPALLLGLGAALFALGAGADLFPPVYAYQDFWHTSPSWLAMRLGVVVAATGALQLVPCAADVGASWLRTLGRHSLLGYVASVELTYGHLTGTVHRALSLSRVVAGMAAMAGLTWALSAASERFGSARAPAPASRSPSAPPA
jgi:uncharacterized membrane protein